MSVSPDKKALSSISTNIVQTFIRREKNLPSRYIHEIALPADLLTEWMEHR